MSMKSGLGWPVLFGFALPEEGIEALLNDVFDGGDVVGDGVVEGTERAENFLGFGDSLLYGIADEGYEFFAGFVVAEFFVILPELLEEVEGEIGDACGGGFWAGVDGGAGFDSECGAGVADDGLQLGVGFFEEDAVGFGV